MVIVEAFARTRARHQIIMYAQYRSELLETDAEAGVSGAEQEYSLSKAKVKHNRAWARNGWMTYVLRFAPALSFVRGQIL